jgi:hypothetical protein
MIVTDATSKRNMAYPKSVGRSSIPSSIPCSYDLIYVESHASEEKPSAGRWSAEDESR